MKQGNIFVKLDGKNAGNLTWKYDEILRIFSIESIFVERGKRRRGVGTKLLQKGLAKAHKFHKIYGDVCIALKVDKGFKDFKLKKWFKKHGFKKGIRFKTMRTMYLHL